MITRQIESRKPIHQRSTIFLLHVDHMYPLIGPKDSFTVQHLVDVPTSAFKAEPPAKKDQVLSGHIAFPVLSPGISIEAHLHPPWADLRIVTAHDLAGKHHRRSHSRDVARLSISISISIAIAIAIALQASVHLVSSHLKWHLAGVEAGHLCGVEGRLRAAGDEVLKLKGRGARLAQIGRQASIGTREATAHTNTIGNQRVGVNRGRWILRIKL
mmetsp:Transcript_59700/g.94526  ORF Transcript_59700/g.94526 Transcript_59700/m.94526 type:complete len:214 (-) Transcript_59700:335-976(-)